MKVLVPRNKDKEMKAIPEIELQFSLPDRPILGILELTSRCNFSCPHCYLGNKYSVRELSFDLVCNLLEQCREMKIEKVLLTGGEVGTRKDLVEIIKFAHRCGLKIDISTNGSLLSEEVLDAIKKYVDKVQITVYGMKKETYSRSSSDPAALETVIALVEKISSEKLICTFTLTPYNYQDLSTFLKFCEERKINCKIGRILPIGLARKDKNFFNPSYVSKFQELEKEWFREPRFPFRNRGCPFDRITVLSNGKVTICPLSRETPQLIFGDVSEKTLMKIWEEKMRLTFPSFLVDNMEICKDCEFKYLCGGGCPTIWNVLGPIKKIKSPPCKSPFLTRRYILEDIQ